MKRLLLICGFMLVLVPAALAGTPAAVPTVASSASPIGLDAPFTWSGCGYRPGQQLRLQTSGLTTTGEYEFASSVGCFVSTVWIIPSLYYPAGGTETASVFDASNGKPKTQRLASVSVTVVPAA